jgi:hypothetical protein
VALAGCLPAATAWAQQNVPPRPEATAVRRTPLAAAVAERTVVHPDAFKAEVFKGAALTEGQKQAVLKNMAGAGLSQQIVPGTMQQYFGPVPPGQATGMACTMNYAGTPAELASLRKTVAGLVEKNKASDLPSFLAKVPKDCPYSELYYYLDVLSQLVKG